MPVFMQGFVAGAGSVVAMFIVFGLVYSVIRPWLRMKLMGGRGSLMQVMAMRLRGTPPTMIVEAYTSLLHSGEQVRLNEVESQYVANRARIMDPRDLIDIVRELKRREAQAAETAPPEA